MRLPVQDKAEIRLKCVTALMVLHG